MGYHGDGGPALEAAFYHPEHLAFDSRGDLYVCDNSNDRVRKITLATGIVSTVLGTGRRASNGDGGPAVEASTLMPDAICLDAHDNLYVGEKYGFRVRKVAAATGIVQTLAGTGVPGFGEEGLPGAVTHVNSCEAGIWADPDGTVFWGDCSGRLRRYDGRTGIVTTALGGTGVGDGGPATAAYLCGPGGLACGADGTLYIADVWSQRIRAIDPQSGTIRTVAGNGARAYGGDGGPATAAYLGNPHAVAVDPQGRLIIADTRHAHIRRVDADGIIRTVVGTGMAWDSGDGGPALGASIVHVEAVAVGPDGAIYLGDAIGRIRRVDPQTGVIRTVAGNGLAGYSGDGGPASLARIGTPTAIGFDPQGNLYFSDRAFHVVRRVAAQSGRIDTLIGNGHPGFSPDDTAGTTAQLHTPWGLAIGPDGTLYIADSGNNRVLRLHPGGVIDTILGAGATTLNEPHGLFYDPAHRLFVSDHFNNRVLAVQLPDA